MIREPLLSSEMPNLKHADSPTRHVLVAYATTNSDGYPRVFMHPLDQARGGADCDHVSRLFDGERDRLAPTDCDRERGASSGIEMIRALSTVMCLPRYVA